MKRVRFIPLLLSLALGLAGCGQSDSDTKEKKVVEAKTLKSVTVVLDWTPNTNHTGLFVAQEKDFYKDAGLHVKIVKPGSNGADAMVASGSTEFGVSYQESVTQARISGVPLVSIAAVIQHNTSGFASPAAKNIKSPKDFVGKTYGGWGSPVEHAMIDSLMQTEKADASKVKIVSIGEADYFTAVKRDIDFAWIFYGWTGIDAELRNEPINMIYVNKYSDKLDYYTPVLVTNEQMIKEKPEVVKAFMEATSKGYQYAIDHPDDAAKILLKAAPDLDEKLVVASQKWLSTRYQDDAPRWGEQKRSVWENYATWMYDHKLLEKKLDVDAAFTNQFLPESK